MNCPKCSKEMKTDGVTLSTLVGYVSPKGHDHNDNCIKRWYTCECGYELKISKRNKCYNPECDWIGKDECFCHEGKKVDEWP